MPIEYSSRFKQKYVRLPLELRNKVDKAIRLLDENFRHPGLRSHPLKSKPGVFEASVDAKYRMTYERRGDILYMRNLDNHDECLKNP